MCNSVSRQTYRKKRLVFIKHIFYKIINKVSDVSFVQDASDFRLMKKEMVEALLCMKEYHRFSKGMFSYIGFYTKYVPYTVETRKNGNSKWNFRKLLKYGIDGILSFSTMPLKIPIYLGICFVFCSLIMIVALIIQNLTLNILIISNSTILIIILLVGGLILFCLGIIGEYLSKIYIQTKDRPIYILKEWLKAKK